MSDFNQAKYIQEYQKEKYDRCIFNVPKGHKAEITAFYKECGYNSLNAYVNTLIQNDMDIVHKEMNKLDADEKYLVNCYRYAGEEDKKELMELACKIEGKLSQLEKQKLFNLRKHVIEKQVDEEWRETFGQEKLPPFYTE